MARNYYDQIAKGYDELHYQEQSEKIKVVKTLITILPNSNILDLGCGPYYGQWNVDNNSFMIKGCNVVGVDPSKELLKKAAAKGIKTILGKAEHLNTLGFKDKEFDYCISITACQNFDDLDKAFSEIKRVSRKAVITFLKGTTGKNDEKKIITALKQWFRIINIFDQGKDWIYMLEC